jgi:DNA-binding winged helix-turn-helix (wHTH) protein
MKITALDKNKVQVTMETGEASQLLEGLETLRSELGPLGEELIAALRRNGITLRARSDSTRTENGSEH